MGLFQTWSRTPGCKVTGKVPKTTGKGRRKHTLVLAMKGGGISHLPKGCMHQGTEICAVGPGGLNLASELWKGQYVSLIKCFLTG